jgi:hypothetical protein
MRLLKKIVCRPYHTYSIEYFHTEERQYNHEIWTISPAVATTESDFCEYLREHYTIFSDSQGELLDGGTRLSPLFDTWCAARALRTQQVYGWRTFQQAIDHYAANGYARSVTQPPRTPTGRVQFSTPRTGRNDWAALYGNHARSVFSDEGAVSGRYAQIITHHHYCDKCQKTRKCGLCDGKPKVRKLCESCEMAETIRSIQGVTMSTPSTPANQYRVSVNIETANWWHTNGLASVHGASNNSGNDDPQT